MADLLSPRQPFFLRAGRARLPYAIVTIAAAAAIVLANAHLGPFIAQALRLSALFPPPEVRALSPIWSAAALVTRLLLGAAPLMGLIALWLRLVERRAFHTIGFRPRMALRQFVRGLLCGLPLFTAPVVALLALGGLASEHGAPQMQGPAASYGVLLTLVGWIVQASAEESLARGWLLQSIGARVRPWVGVLVSAGFFALLHALNPNLAPIAVLNLVLFGLFASIYTLRERSLWGIAGVHAAWNWAQGNLFGLPVSGIDMSGGALINLAPLGLPALNGGAFGLEGGLAVSATLLLGCLLLLAPLLRRAHYSAR